MCYTFLFYKVTSLFSINHLTAPTFLKSSFVSFNSALEFCILLHDDSATNYEVPETLIFLEPNQPRTHIGVFTFIIFDKSTTSLTTLESPLASQRLPRLPL